MCSKLVFGKLKTDFITKFSSYKNMANVTKATGNSVLKMRDKFLQMPIEEKRSHYKCDKNYVTINDIDTLRDQLKSFGAKTGPGDAKGECKYPRLAPEEAREFGDRVSVWQGDITRLEVDAIVNAANESLLGGGGVDGAIHSAAGNLLLQECRTLGGCQTGGVAVTAGYNLPARYVIHTVGPRGLNASLLHASYSNCLAAVKTNQLTSVAFPCISTGIFGYPNEAAASVAIETVLEFLRSDYRRNIDRIIFTLFLKKDVDIYERLLKQYFDALC